MTTIRNNARCPIELVFVGEGGRAEKLFLLSGVNLSIDDKLWSFAKDHPIVKAYLESSILELLGRAPRIEGELEGLPVSTSKQNDEPLLVTEDGKPAARKAK
jgi:hypothetical protein